LFERVESLRPDLRIVEKTADDTAGIVQRGESTGHAHVIEDMTGVELLSSRWEGRFVRAEKEFTIKHEEHRPLTLPAGNYRIRIAREYNYLQHAPTRVVD
jgi:hypothetical protein